MTTCHEVRAALRTGGGEGLQDEAARHIASCPACQTEERAVRLLLIGSEPVSPILREGFEGRLQARIAARNAAPHETAWADAIGLFVRPAILAAACAAVLTIGTYVLMAQATVASEYQDLASLALPAGDDEALLQWGDGR